MLASFVESKVSKIFAGKLFDLLISGVPAGQRDIQGSKRSCRTNLCLLLALPLLLSLPGGRLAGEERPKKDANSGIELKKPSLPNGKPDDHPIDRFLAAYFQKHSVVTDNAVDDAVFARRVYLDVIGLLPTQKELNEFLADNRAEKRALLVDRLLADRDSYAVHWMSFWNDALRNDYRGTGYIDGGRKQITQWLYRALANNMPYDRFVRELVSPSPASEGFVKGIVWRGVVNASQVPEVQAAQNISQVFLGINLKCASCHDSFINAWTLKEAYGLAGVFADRPLEMHHCDKPTGEFAPLQFLYPELGTIDAGLSREQRMARLAELMTHPANGRLARTIVNRFWAKLFGRGFMEPVDEMDDPAWNADLLDWLAADLVENKYDLQNLLRRILTSRAYQLPAKPGTELPEERFVFRGPVVRRMSAEQYLDAVSALTGVWQSKPAAVFGSFADNAKESGDGGKNVIRYRSGIINAGSVDIDVDITGAATLWLVVTQGNGGTHFDWANWLEPRLVKDGETKKLTDVPWRSATSGYGKVQLHRNVVEGPLASGGKSASFGIGTHADSVIGFVLPPGFERFQVTAGIDDQAMAKSKEGHDMEFLAALVVGAARSRAAAVEADPLMVALGRPNREQVVTQRPTSATTLEALELTNGETLRAMVDQGARHWLAKPPGSTRELADGMYRQALGRAPTEKETEIALEFLGETASPEGVADFLWVLIMMPEFQLIY
ncbi:MAG: DUF1549 domain-containing protein [Planctomycetota bacterium]